MHIYKDHLNWIDIKSITNVIKVKFIKVKEFRIAALGLHQFWAFVCFSYLSLLPNQFLLYITFQYPLKLLRKDWKKGLMFSTKYVHSSILVFGYLALL